MSLGLRIGGFSPGHLWVNPGKHLSSAILPFKTAREFIIGLLSRQRSTITILVINAMNNSIT